ncbi:thioredoxin family protein [Halogeometricum sp. S1BR25-6]|uniref:Thioredoxin family protein n=1 Tax=Halogeometricum salsisoli TaxID=2950536 RepID=A0ABU2GK64_9EURY|nr:thioredoxin family protein [Halogeometricum sp. S1BR25-6]MDS0301218.1 thioredoxin family protein [Halogeometricum sp. S1BR25-6]
MWLSYNTVVYNVTEVILFTQETCGACATQREKNDGLEDKYPDVEFKEVDIQTDLETAEEYGVRKTPTTLVYANGEQTAEFIGIVDRNDLESAIERATQQSSGFVQRLVGVVRK